MTKSGQKGETMQGRKVEKRSSGSFLHCAAPKVLPQLPKMMSKDKTFEFF
jgi:hypothetical protein